MHHATPSRSPHNALHSPCYWGEPEWPPTLAWLHCKTRVYVCLRVAIYRKFKFEWNGYDGTRTFQISTRAKALQNSCSVQVDSMDPSLSNSMPMDLLNVTEDSSPCNSTPMNLLSVRQIASGGIDAYASTNTDQRNSPQLGKPGMMLKNRTPSL